MDLAESPSVKIRVHCLDLRVPALTASESFRHLDATSFFTVRTLQSFILLVGSVLHNQVSNLTLVQAFQETGIQIDVVFKLALVGFESFLRLSVKRGVYNCGVHEQ